MIPQDLEFQQVARGQRRVIFEFVAKQFPGPQSRRLVVEIAKSGGVFYLANQKIRDKSKNQNNIKIWSACELRFSNQKNIPRLLSIRRISWRASSIPPFLCVL